MALTSAQETEYARLSDERKAVLDPDKAKFERFTPAELKAKVNILGIGAVVKWADECNYTDAEKAYVEATMPRNKWATEVPLLLAEAAALEADGSSATLIKSILKSR